MSRSQIRKLELKRGKAMSIKRGYLLLLFLLVFIFGGCASRLERYASDGIVIPQPDGIYVASGSSVDAKYALQVALASAELCCMKQSKRHVVLGIKTNADKGLVDDTTADVVDVISKIPAVGGVFLPIDELRGEKHVQVQYRCE